MEIKNPCIITSRLCAGLEFDDGTISIEYSDKPGVEGRTRYKYYLDIMGFEHEDDDLQSGCGGGTLQEGLESLLGYLAAAAESYRYNMGKKKADRDNEKSFPPEIMEWAYQHSDEISMFECELQETPEVIKE